jgi:hypothetical protein
MEMCGSYGLAHGPTFAVPTNNEKLLGPLMGAAFGVLLWMYVGGRI